ncbi:MAG: EAL domain-containing protein [Gammaproteobacteria bacterium]|nr:EAL domain-containing protein [Gammaproteobacteria bacterium]
MRAAIKKVIALDFGQQTTTRLPHEPATRDPYNNLEGIAILVTKDTLSLQWAPRWLQHTGLAVKIAHSSADALDIASTTHPRLMIVDAALVADDQTPLLQTLRKMHDESVPMFALCNNGADVDIANAADVTDIVRKPFDWNLITRRAVRAIKAQDTLDKLQQAYSQVDQMHTTVTAAERERAKVAGMDRTTRLPNGERFRSLMHKAIGNPHNADNDLAVLVIGLDRFRTVNEAVGRQNANRLLGMFADRLRTCLASRDVIGDADGGAVTASAGRLGGARFAMMISNAKTDEIVRVRQAIQAQLGQPFEVAGQSIYLTVSIGAAIFPHDNSNADGLLHCAENAMLEAKEAGTGFEFYTEPGDASSLRLLNLDRMLREAVANNDLELAYQPIIATDSGDVVGAEALLRWNHAEEGMISPADFVPVAEKTGLMKDIGDLVIAAACRQLRSWLDAGMQPIRMAINLSLCQLLRGDVVAVVEKALNDNRLQADLLEIELSERGVLNQRPQVIDEIRRLKSLGVRISIDDFGTGQAAIGYLKDLPVDVIKIDRSYVSGAHRDTRDDAIASGMVALAQRLNATVIAEGVETAEQLNMLRNWGSQECQGFLFSPAIPASDFLRKFS